MSSEIAQLERAWLKAEAVVDELKQEASKASAELARMRQVRGEETRDLSARATTVEQLMARREEAERTASAAFDRYWSAQTHGSGSGSAYA